MKAAVKAALVLLALCTALTAQTRAVTTVQKTQQRDALVLYQNADYNAAIEQCEREIAADPSRIDAYVIMCWCLVATKRYAEAQKQATEGLKQSPYDLRLIEVYGEAKYYLGDNAGALEQFQKYAARSTENGARLGAAYYFMGEIYVRQSRFQHADISLSTAVKKEPLIDRWWSRLGYAREMAGNYREAITAYDEALRLNSALLDAVNGRKRVADKLQ